MQNENGSRTDEERQGGLALLEEIVDHVGLPKEWTQKELFEILEKSGCSPEQVTLEDLRKALLEYLDRFHAAEDDHSLS